MAEGGGGEAFGGEGGGVLEDERGWADVGAGQRDGSSGQKGSGFDACEVAFVEEVEGSAKALR